MSVSGKHKQRLCRICRKRAPWHYKNCPPGICKRCYHKEIWPDRPAARKLRHVLKDEPNELGIDVDLGTETATGDVGLEMTGRFDVEEPSEFETHIESDVGAHIDNATVAWVFDLNHWGVCGQGHDEVSALAALEVALGKPTAGLTVVERISGDEQAFIRDRWPAEPTEVARTLEILGQAREETLALIASASTRELDWDDPERVLPPWATWRTIRQMGWHLADTESRYYLPSLGVPPLPRAADLPTELRRSYHHVRSTLMQIASDECHRTNQGEEWTTVKVLRRLAWHERSELVTIRRLLDRARIALFD